MPEYRVDPHVRPVLIFRWFVFLLAAGFVLRQIVFAGDYAHAGGPFRFLTTWAQLLSFFAASRMLALSERRSTHDWPILVAVAAVVNGMVVILFWALWLDDPTKVRAGTPLPWHVTYYIHAIGPALLWFDALAVYGGLRRFWWSLAALVGTLLAYLIWVEVFVGPLNEVPYGAVTSGLPYPVLNDLEPGVRAALYAQAIVGALMLLLVLFGLARGISGSRTRA